MGQFVINITACPIRRGARRVSAGVLAVLYKAAVLAEMHESVKQVVTVNSRGDEDAKTDGIQVRLSTSAKRQTYGAITTKGQAYMFQLRDAVEEVIRSFVPPLEAWVDDQAAPHPLVQLLFGVLSMPEATADAPAQASASAAPPATLKLDASHVPQIAAAIHSFHFPHIPIDEITNPSATFIDDAKSFVAAFNAVLGIFEQLQAGKQAQMVQQQADLKAAQEKGAPTGQSPQTGAAGQAADPNTGSSAG